MAIGIVGSNNGYSRTASDNRFLKLSGGTVNGNLAINSGSISTSQPLTLTQTWTNAAVTYTGLQVNVTDTASNAASLLMDLRVGGVSRFRVGKGGTITSDIVVVETNGGSTRISSTSSNANGLKINAFNSASPVIQFSGSVIDLFMSSGQAFITTDANNTLAQRNGGAAQTFRLYNTYTSATSFERLDFRWDSNVAKIGTQKGATSGVARDLALETDGTTRMTITSAGNVGIGTATPTTKLEITTAVAGDGIKLNRSDGERVAWLVDEGSGSGALYMFNGSNSNSVFITANGNSFLNGGNVGIGTSSPSAGKLVVDGNIAFNNFGQRLIFDGSATHGYVDTFAAGGARRARIYGYAGVTLASNLVSQGLTMVENGNVGIGTTTPTAKLDILDTTLAGSGSLSGSALNIDQTWNTTGTPTAIKLNVTDTASNAASLLMDLQVGGVSQFRVDKNGSIKVPVGSASAPTLSFASVSNTPQGLFQGGTRNLIWATDGTARFITGYGGTFIGSDDSFGWSSFSSASGPVDVKLVRDAANTLAQRNGGAAQAFRVYNTFTSRTVSDTTLETLEIKGVAANNFIIQSMRGTTGGVARDIEFRHGAVDTNGTVTNGTLIATVKSTGLEVNGGYNTTPLTVKNGAVTSFSILNNGGGASSTVSNGIFTLGTGGQRLIITDAGGFSLPAADTVRVFPINFNSGVKLQLITSHGSNAAGTNSLEFLSNTAGSASYSTGSVNASIENSLDNTLKFKVAESIAGNGTSTNLREVVRIIGSGNVGIGTTSPASKLTVTGGDIEVTDSASGIILKSPNGTRWRIIIDDSGELTTTAL